MSVKRSFYGYLEGILSIIVNTGLFVLKFWIGTLVGSIALVADAWHSLSDSFTSLIVLIGINVSQKPADREHPFGHGRFELIASVIIAVILGMVALDLIVESVAKIKSGQTTEFGKAAVIALVVSIVMKELLAQYAIRAGRRINSQALIADGWHHRSDSISTLLILAGIFLNPYLPWIDGTLGIIVSCILLYAGYRILSSSVSKLIGEKPDDDLLASVRKIASELYDRNLGLHHFHLHEYGEHSELTFHISLPGDMSLREAHGIADRIEEAVREKHGLEVTIHMDVTEHQAFPTQENKS